MVTSPSWRVLTRGELKPFDTVAQDIILAAMNKGAKGRISTKGHVILRSPKGGTMAVSRNTSAGNRTAANCRADFKRLFADLPDVEPDLPAGQEEETRTDVDASFEIFNARPPADALHPTINCSVEDCEAVFVTEGARYSHVQKVHHKCPEPGCDYIGKSNNGLAAHTRIRHGTNRPWEVRSQKAASMRASDAKTLAAIRELLGTDPQVAELEKALKAERAKVKELETKLGKLREALA